MQKIRRAFHRVQSALGVDPARGWSEQYYQYANRIAFLWWLRDQGVDAKLLFVSFLNDSEMGGPSHPETWRQAFADADRALGLPRSHPLSTHILHVFPDTNIL